MAAEGELEAAAELAIVMDTTRGAVVRLDHGTAMELRILGATRSMIVRHVSAGYDLAVLLAAPEVSAHAAAVMALYGAPGPGASAGSG